MLPYDLLVAITQSFLYAFSCLCPSLIKFNRGLQLRERKKNPLSRKICVLSRALTKLTHFPQLLVRMVTLALVFKLFEEYAIFL